MEPEVSLPRSQEPVIGSYRERDTSILHLTPFSSPIILYFTL